MLTRTLFTISFSLCIAVFAQAQGFQIRTVNEGFGKIGIQVRDTTDVPVLRSNFITDIVFGVKWKSSYNVDLAAVPTNSYNIAKSGLRTAKDSFYFQAFYANNTPYQLPEDWPQDTWIEILSVSNTLTGADTGTFQICENGFDATTNLNIGIDLIDYTPAMNGEANGVVLPVNLLSFTVAPVNNTIRLNWSTTSEINNKGFEIQRSEGNTNNYVAIGFVNSQSGNSRNNYNFTDIKASGGVRYYYRLKQVDLSGNYRYSDTRDGMLDKVKNALLQLAPNPAKEFINLQFSNDCLTKQVNIKITDGKGSLINAWKEAMQAGKTIQKSVSGLAGGQYFLTVEDESGVIFTTSFQKM